MPSAEGPRESKKVTALVVAVLASVAMVLWMAKRDPFFLGPLWGTLIALVASAGWVAWLVPVPSGDPVPWRETTLGKKPGEVISPIAAGALAAAVVAIGCLVGGYDGLPITICVALACLVPPALRRPGLLVLIIVSAIYLPLLGTYSLWDPWETHYGEVAREILARNDWISLWWAQDNWFWSKPILLFWAEAWSMGVAGVDFLPDAHPAHPEWAIRMPTFVMTIAALGVIYATIRRQFGARAGALAVLVTATMPQFFFISRQAITDLPLVAAITIAACCLLLAVEEDPEREATVFRIGPVKLSLQHAILFLVVLAVLPQAAYLISRNVSWIDGWHLVTHPDRFLYGSAGNIDIPGNPDPREQLPRVQGFGG
ncbi:MAG: glycosyltransferase family 39 protein, partial [Myxococcales bacterium]|nr:glycosyltransferase family 39 protein [Myxococcales bacterium]